MSDEPENLVLHLLRKLDAKADSLDAKVDKLGVDLRAEIVDLRADMRSEINSVRADVASDLMTLEKRLGDQIVGLRRAVMEYHSSAIGHGALISELDERVRRLEQHLKLPPRDAH